jgi:regulator of protease activity HflC (stomatin/prohibitin superfamily)
MAFSSAGRRGMMPGVPPRARGGQGDANMSEHEFIPPPIPARAKASAFQGKPVRIGPGLGLLAGPLVILAAVLLLPIWFWFFCRIEPGPGEIAILIRKTGQDLPSGQILALEEGQKGIQLNVLAEGRYFKNPYTWGWQIRRITDIPAGKLGVLTRLYGQDLPDGQILAPDGYKGIVPEVLRPGKYRINPFAYGVQQFDATTVRPGFGGVVTALTGADVLNGEVPAEDRNTFLVKGGQKGVQPDILDAGTYYLNPYMVVVTEVNLQSQRFEMSGEDSISFLTLDGFTVNVEGTIEYALIRDQVARLTHQVGDMDDILKKIVLPKARGFSRIEGSKNPAKNYIAGVTRQKFQDNLEAHLIAQCKAWGVDIKSVLIRNITPPDAIASIIRDREVAVQDANKYGQQIEQAKSEAELVKQEMLAVQNKEKVEADTRRIRAVIAAEQGREVRLTQANRDLEVAKLENAAAKAQAEAKILRATAEGQVIRMKYEAEAGVIENQVQAFGTGLDFARYTFYGRIGPKIRSILAGDQGGGLGELFQGYVPAAAKGGAQ